MKAVRGCLLWLAVYALLAFGLAYAVERRIGERQPAVVAGLIAGFIAWIALAYLAAVIGKLRELRLVWSATNGAEPVDGGRFAAIGPITPTGRALVSPLTHTPAVAYHYEILQTDGKWEGVALVPSSIRCGANAIRLLALPELDFKKSRVTDDGARRNAEEYIRTTEFLKPGADPSKSFKDIWSIYTDDDGAVRQDLGPSNETKLDRALLIEQVVKPGETVCAFGRYSAARGGLVVDAKAPLHSVRLTKGEPGAIMGSRLRKMTGEFIAGTALLAAVALALAGFYALVPLDVVANPSWTEIRIEDVIDRHVRPRLAAHASMLPTVISLGDALQRGEARGRIREWTVTRARAEAAEGAVEVTLFDGDKAVAVLTLVSGELREVKVLSETIDVPPSRFTFRRIGENEFAGRLSWADGRVHVVFRTAI
jgi:hypothetical protein